jgi:mRNA interferase RelE/StbE
VKYSVAIQPAAQRDFDALPAEARATVAARLRELAAEPRPAGAAALQTGPRGCHRLRVGDYRVGYRVDDGRRAVTVWAIGHRSTFYKTAERRRR